MPAPGDVIASKYEVVRKLGEGGMGAVYEANHLRLRQRVALKVLLPSMTTHPVLVTRFEREARAAGQLRSPHAVRVIDVDATAEGLPYIVMEFLDGHDVASELERRERLPYGEAVDLVLQASAAMIEAHRLGIIHRDLKPSNLFLCREVEGTVVKVLDFGISKVQNETDSKLTGAESVMGTAMYMSPEQVKASSNVDARADIWSLGVILFELLAGRAPWLGTPTQVAAAIVTEDPPNLLTLCRVPLELSVVLHRALQREPAARYPDVKSFAAALAPYAPPASLGRMIADSLSGTPSAPPRVSLGPTSTPRAPFAVTEPSQSRLLPSTMTAWEDEPARVTKRRALTAVFAVLAALLVAGLAFVVKTKLVRPRPSVVASEAQPPPPPPASEVAPVVLPAPPPTSTPEPAAQTPAPSAAATAKRPGPGRAPPPPPPARPPGTAPKEESPKAEPTAPRAPLHL